MVLIRIFEFRKKSQAVNQFSKSIEQRYLGIMYRKVARSTSIFMFTFGHKNVLLVGDLISKIVFFILKK